MREPQDVKMYFYIDESGDPTILAKGGRNLLDAGTASKTFIVGYVETPCPSEISKALVNLRKFFSEDEYLKGIPSLSSSLRSFHANKDCPEIKEKVFRLLRDSEYQAFAIVARKDEALFRKKFDLKPAKLYEYLVSNLLENRLHFYRYIDIYFSSMGSVVRDHTMRQAIETAMEKFKTKWGKANESKIRVFIQRASEHPMLQVVDYTLWTVNRAYEKGDFRYYNFLKDRISLVHDIFDINHYPNTYYTSTNPLSEEKMSPMGS